MSSLSFPLTLTISLWAKEEKNSCIFDLSEEYWTQLLQVEWELESPHQALGAMFPVLEWESRCHYAQVTYISVGKTGK